ncbi:MAG: hypothetical protein AB197_00200 [Parcubacteria bacterium C7867-002]|nr:MAG: hypothetical protein AB197_00200 [Parcubacteria bacterium C7867-002]
MKKYTYTPFVISLFTITLCASPVFATVGGPTYIGFFKYNSADESVYYVEHSQSGRGCPPELKKISLATEKDETVFSCTQGEELTGSNYTEGLTRVRDHINEITAPLKDITPISLPKNNIRIDVEFVRSEHTDPTIDWTTLSHFVAKVYQGTTKVDEFPITGCNTEQPFSFAGYAIPGFEKKIVLLSSTKGDCFEGGYTVERLHVAAGLDGLNKEYSGQYKTDQSPLTPHESTVVLFERDTVDLSESPATPNTSRTTNVTILLIVIALGLGVFLGRMIGVKK